MIICITENSTEWDDFGQPYLIDTSLLKEEYLRGYLEVSVEVIKVDSNNGRFIDSWNKEDIFAAMIKPPQMVDKLISIIFEEYE